MPVGIPGTALGCVFYACLVIAMPLRAAGRWFFRGATTADEWRCCARHLAILAALFGVMWLESLALHALAAIAARMLPAGSIFAGLIREASQTVSPSLVWLPFIVIAIIALALALLRQEVLWWEQVRRRSAAATFRPASPLAAA